MGKFITILYELINESENITINPLNKEKYLEEVRANFNVNIYDTYEKSKEEYKQERSENTSIILTSSVIILAISLIEIFLMIRSSFLSKIKETGIYRTIGVKEKDIYIMFSGETIAITTLASLLGILLFTYILKVITKISFMSRQFMNNPNIIIIAIVIVYTFHLIVDLIPVFTTLWSPPQKF